MFLSSFSDGFYDAFNGDTAENTTLIKSLMILGFILVAVGIVIILKPDKDSIKKISTKIIAWICVIAGAILEITCLAIA